MRRLSLLRKDKSKKQKWRDIQQKQIDESNASDLKLHAAFPVSYTHLTLPTILLV